MRIIDYELPKTPKWCFYADFDLTPSFRQLGLYPNSQESESIKTTDGLLSPRHIFHGTTNALLHVESFFIDDLPTKLRDHILLWADYCLFRNETIKDRMEELHRFFTFCRDFHWLLNPLQCELFRLHARWCGCLISSDGVRHYSGNNSGLLEMDRPTTGGQHQQFLCALQWARSTIPQFQALVHEMHEFLERVYVHAGKRT